MGYLKIKDSKSTLLHSIYKRNKKNILIPQYSVLRFQFPMGECYSQKLKTEKGKINIKHFLVSQKCNIHIYCDKPVLLFKFRVNRWMFKDKIRLNKNSTCYLVYYPKNISIPITVQENTTLIFFECMTDFLHLLVHYEPRVMIYLDCLQEERKEIKISPPFATNKEMRALLEDILNLNVDHKHSSNFRVLSLFTHFLSHALIGFQELSAINKEGVSDKEMIMEIKQFILEHLNQDLSLESLSKRFYISVSNLSLKFEKYLSCSLSDFVYKERMKLAKQLLLETSKTNHVIAYEIGYESGESFSKAFKKMAKESPGKYKKRKKS